MHPSATSSPPGNAEARLLILIMLGTVALSFATFFTDRLRWAVLPTIYALPFLLAAALFLAIGLARKGSSSAPLALMILGTFYIMGGAILDMVATVLQTPTLDQEANIIARGLLDSGHAVSLVFAYGIITQSLLVALICILWLSLLRHREALITSIGNPGSFMTFLKAATGGAHLTWRQWILPLQISELPQAYLVFWVVVVVAVAAMSDRWYLGIEWFTQERSWRFVVFGGALSIGLIVYFTWLRLATQQFHSVRKEGNSP